MRELWRRQQVRSHRFPTAPGAAAAGASTPARSVLALTRPVGRDPGRHLVTAPDAHPAVTHHVDRLGEAWPANNLHSPRPRHAAEHRGDVCQGDELHDLNVGRQGVTTSALTDLTLSK